LSWRFGTRTIGKTIVVALDHEQYKKLIVEIANPREVVDRLQAVLEPFHA
jgi:hypothetical protein